MATHSRGYRPYGYTTEESHLAFASRVGNDRLVRACRRAASSGLYNYSAVDTILRSRHDCLDGELTEDEQSDMTEMPEHANIRGKEYYR